MEYIKPSNPFKKEGLGLNSTLDDKDEDNNFDVLQNPIGWSSRVGFTLNFSFVNDNFF